MKKYAYARLTGYEFSVRIRMSDALRISPLARKVEEEQALRRDGVAYAASASASHCHTWECRLRSESEQLYMNVVRMLADDGWEPFSAEGWDLHFRRLEAPE